MAALTGAYDPLAREGRVVSYPVAGGVTIYKGAMVAANDSGYARPVAAGNGGTDKFLGVALETVTSTANGEKSVRVLKSGVFTYNGSGLTQALVGTTVYGQDDNTITTTATNNIPVGVVVEVLSATRASIRIDPMVK